MAFIQLSVSDLAILSPASREEVLRLVSGVPVMQPPAEDDLTGDLVTLTVVQARQLIEGCSARPRAALRWISELRATTFTYERIVEAVGADDTGGIRGVTAALTRRTRTVTGIADALLLGWIVRQDGGGLFRVSPGTQAALRQAFAPAAEAT